MQISRRFTGSIASAGSASSRQPSYGLSNTISAYQNKVDFFNQCVADFLHDDCGVSDAVYEARDGSTNKFLWIYNAPFLYCPNTTSNYYFGFYGPGYATALWSGNASATMFFTTGATSTAYDFTLYFDGDPDHGFVLRPTMGTSTPSQFCFTVFAKAKNLINGKSAVCWKYAYDSSTTIYSKNANGIDINVDRTIDLSSFNSTSINFFCNLQTSENISSTNPGKLPLVPINIGIWELEGQILLACNTYLPIPKYRC